MNKLMLALQLQRVSAAVLSKLGNKFKDERGEVNIVAIVVLIGIAVLLALFFKEQIMGLLTSLFQTITGTATDAVGGGGGE